MAKVQVQENLVTGDKMQASGGLGGSAGREKSLGVENGCLTVRQPRTCPWTTLREKRKHRLCGVNAPVSSNQKGGAAPPLARSGLPRQTITGGLETHNRLLVPTTQGDKVSSSSILERYALASLGKRK